MCIYLKMNSREAILPSDGLQRRYIDIEQKVGVS